MKKIIIYILFSVIFACGFWINFVYASWMWLSHQEDQNMSNVYGQFNNDTTNDSNTSSDDTITQDKINENGAIQVIGKKPSSSNELEEFWLEITDECLLNGQCSMNIDKMLWINQSSDWEPEVSTFVQDIILWATMFFGTVLTIVIIMSGIMFISAWVKWDASGQANAKKLLINSIIGFVLVISSYWIVRLIQFLATAGGW